MICKVDVFEPCDTAGAVTAASPICNSARRVSILAFVSDCVRPGGSEESDTIIY